MAADVTAVDVLVFIMAVAVAMMPFRRSNSFGRGQSANLKSYCWQG